jgi:hypothetical protein
LGAAAQQGGQFRASGGEIKAPGDGRARPLYQPLQPQPAGAIYIMSEEGLQIINPAAPPRLGYEAQLKNNAKMFQGANLHNKPLDGRNYRGIVLFGWFF